MSEKNKLSGKTEWSGRRRPMTRKAGFNATAPVELDSQELEAYRLEAGESLTLTFSMPAVEAGDWVGFGGWFCATPGIRVELETGHRSVLTQYPYPDWNKVGSLHPGPIDARDATLSFSANEAGQVTLYSMLSGGVAHRHLQDVRAGLRSMWSFAPEANFYDAERPGDIVFSGQIDANRVPGEPLTLKSCNRCGRFLPINFPSERRHLSYTNHCTAEHRRPCRHSGFGKILIQGSDEYVQFEYGFQLECRFCKKFEVNAAHNPQRTAGQMKEDSTRRRHLELLLEHLYRGTPQLRYKVQTGRDLAQDIYDRFEGTCFKCGAALATPRAMNLDHTRPLALLWPLDATATALCKTHNSEKRDRPPVEYYTEEELARLSCITGVSLTELKQPHPNMEAVALLGERLDWFYDEFLRLPALQAVRDGKRGTELVVKALNKVLSKCPGGAPYHLVDPAGD